VEGIWWGTYAVGCAGVGHGVTAVAVGDVLEDKRSLAGGGPLTTELNGGLDSQDVHTVDLETGNVLSAGVVVRSGGSAVSSSAHTVLVV